MFGALALVLAIAGAVAWYELEAHPLGAPGRTVMVDVHPGEATSSVLGQLTRDGVIGSSFAFKVWTVVHGQPTIRPGRYLLHRNLPFAAASAALAAGPNVYEVVVRPGNTLSEIATQLSALPGKVAGPFLSEARHGAVSSPFEPAPGTSLEGLIGTGSYLLRPGESAHDLLAEMVARFDAEARRAGLEASASVGGLNPYQVVTVASIAQKEGYFDRYLGDVSRVIYNRLARDMALDMTSTVLYSLGVDGGQVTAADQRIPSPYNTYLHKGLTPTPICTPSEKALAAAIAPPSGTWLYFELVTAKKGVMVFSVTYTQQVAAERQATAKSKGTSSSKATTST